MLDDPTADRLQRLATASRWPDPHNPNRNVLTLDEAAEYLRRSTRSIVRQKCLLVFRVGLRGRPLYHRIMLDAYDMARRFRSNPDVQVYQQCGAICQAIHCGIPFFDFPREWLDHPDQIRRSAYLDRK